MRILELAQFTKYLVELNTIINSVDSANKSDYTVTFVNTCNTDDSNLEFKGIKIFHERKEVVIYLKCEEL